MRGDGRVFRRKVKGVDVGPYWIAYYGPVGTKGGAWGEIRESAETTDIEAAKRMLDKRIVAVKAEELGADPFVRPRRLTVNELLDDAKADLAGKAYERTAISASKNLRRLLGARDVRSVNWKTIKDYENERRTESAAKATIDKETALLVRAFRLGKESRKVTQIPRRANLLAMHENARKVTIDAPKLEELLAAIRTVDVDFADWCEWFSVCAMRPRETSTLTWADYSEGESFGTLTVQISNAKLRESREVPIVGPLEAIIARRITRRRMDCPLVFHSDGCSFENKVGGLPGYFLGIWHAACEKVGLPMGAPADPKRPIRRVSKVTPYCLRHHAARALRSAGVPESVCIAIMGQKSASMFRRYAIVDSTDAAQALRAVGDYVAAQKGKRSKLAVGKFGGVSATKTDD